MFANFGRVLLGNLLAATTICTVLGVQPASAGDQLEAEIVRTGMPHCRNHQPPKHASCVYDARHSPGADSIYAPVSYRLWADGTQVYITHRRAHWLLYNHG